MTNDKGTDETCCCPGSLMRLEEATAALLRRVGTAASASQHGSGMDDNAVDASMAINAESQRHRIERGNRIPLIIGRSAQGPRVAIIITT
eukprot:CAMPEP_0181125938 /NCGR_PEP_ID=MMETSP1071-20121207/27336_1 /TAXON_ID=35127 /ORGANISM="Thalassiosira sp., Strain NH16" /LENGTH=89 /DNA_ID=CAMNT_0023211453 /DNA_START=113 /DNA_END=378 /DNA_ORIENTATION=-